MDRRRFLQTAGVTAAVSLAGCQVRSSGSNTPAGPAEDPSGELTVATYSSFTGEGTAGTWLKNAFEEEFPDTTVLFKTPESGLNEYIGRKQSGANIDADIYVGLNTGELVRAREQLEDPLFDAAGPRLPNAKEVKPDLQIDPERRAVPYDTGYISLVYDGTTVDDPGTFDALVQPEYEGDLITQNAQQSDPGRAFLLWTIASKGEDGYLDYWEDLLENDVTVLSDWEPAYNAWLEGEAPIVVSYSTDQIFWYEQDVDLETHQIGFLNDQGYANPEAMARFTESENPQLAASFMDFILSPEVQAEIAIRNVQFPAVNGVDLPEWFDEHAFEPPEPVTFSYERLQGNVGSWLDEWGRLVASK